MDGMTSIIKLNRFKRERFTRPSTKPVSLPSLSVTAVATVAFIEPCAGNCVMVFKPEIRNLRLYARAVRKVVSLVNLRSKPVS